MKSNREELSPICRPVSTGYLHYYDNSFYDKPHPLVGFSRFAINIQMVVIGDTSDGRKETDLSFSQKLFELVSPECIRSSHNFTDDIKTGKGLFKSYMIQSILMNGC